MSSVFQRCVSLLTSGRRQHRLILCAASVSIAVLFLFCPLQPLKRIKAFSVPAQSLPRLHLLVPATSSNDDLCKLLLSATVLDYPTPALINWGSVEQDDPYVQHLAKVEGILNYLRKFEATKTRNDLVLILDGYDIWLQLPADVLIRRYHAINARFSEKALAIFGSTAIKRHKIRQTILFGPDKLCWPVDFSRAACWAVPEAPLDEFAFGPPRMPGAAHPDYGMPRWLNSGTIMGPVQDLKVLFEATLDRIRNNFTVNSDQLYFADIFGEQELARLQLQPDLLERVKNRINDGEQPSPLPVNSEISANPEFHIGLDYDSEMFQTVAFYERYISWTRPSYHTLSSTVGEGDAKLASYYSYSTPVDLATSDSSPAPASGWDSVDLFYNIATRKVPVMIHFTGMKHLRADWWPNMWYHARSDVLRLEALLRQLRKGSDRLLSTDRIGGMQWSAAQPQGAKEVENKLDGGAWSDSGEWLPWDKLCRSHD